MITKTVNLVQVSTAFRGSAKQASHYKRISRFMAYFRISFTAIARFIVSVFPVGDYWYIAIGRTNWKLGKAES